MAIRGPGIWVLLALLVWLPGCIAKPEITAQDTESEAYVLQCTYAVIEPSCRQKADELCPLGWTFQPTIAGPDYRSTARQDKTAITWPIRCNG